MGVVNPQIVRPTSIGITMFSPEAHGMGQRALSGSAPASAAYPVDNLCIAFPFRLAETTTFNLGWVANGTTPSGNFDVGIYSADGATLHASTGSTATSGTSSAIQSDPCVVTLPPGRYYCALAADNTMTFMSQTVTAAVASALGIVQMASNLPLGSTLTIAAFAQTVLPTGFGLSRKATI